MARLVEGWRGWSRDGAARANTAGGCNGRLSTLAEIRMRSVRAATNDMAVHASRNAGCYGWSWKLTRSSPAVSLATASATAPEGSADDRVTNDLNRSVAL